MGLVLAAFTDDRQAGRIGDARNMILTSVALTTTGEIGLARGIERATVPRPDGDAVTRYGLGMALVQVPAAALAPYLERAAGPGASQTLFLLAPLVLTLVAAGAAGHAARSLGAGERGAAFAVLLASLGSPLGSYGTLDLSEPLQAATLAVAFASSLASARASTPQSGLSAAALAGFSTGLAVLTKPNLIVVAPWALLPLLSGRGEADGASRTSRFSVAALAALPCLGTWAFFEFARFGGLFRGYGGESFSYPPLEGALRLLVGPNRGLLLFFPALVVAALEAFRRARASALSDSGTTRYATVLEVAAALLPLAALWAIAASWWAWHGVAGWGPRLLVPGIPGAAALAATAVTRWPALHARVFVAASIGLNALPLLQSAGPVSSYTNRLAAIRVTPRTAQRFIGTPPEAGGDGLVPIPGAFVVQEVPSASDFVVYPWFLGVRAVGSVAEVARRLGRPPWSAARPELIPETVPFPLPLARIVAPPLGFGFLGRSALGGADLARGEAYTQALSIQVLRALQQRKLDRALDLAQRLYRISPRGEPAALVAESYRLLGRHETLRAYLDSLPRDIRSTPPIYAVLALAARDVGEEAAARAYMQRAAPGIGTPAAIEAASRPVSSWPKDYSGLISREASGVTPALPTGRTQPAR
ncbi:MAG TPA: hypothetical protein VE129_07970 [Thermoanaerobaculia bacterium]|nr:hypothetical protein [Thermoanaerobaculia bacterium]